MPLIINKKMSRQVYNNFVKFVRKRLQIIINKLKI